MAGRGTFCAGVSSPHSNSQRRAARSTLGSVNTAGNAVSSSSWTASGKALAAPCCGASAKPKACNRPVREDTANQPRSSDISAAATATSAVATSAATTFAGPRLVAVTGSSSSPERSITCCELPAPQLPPPTPPTPPPVPWLVPPLVPPLVPAARLPHAKRSPKALRCRARRASCSRRARSSIRLAASSPLSSAPTVVLAPAPAGASALAAVTTPAALSAS
eukprot:scaffold60208_cov63-Phaeocystis_antarctica.AAC.1